MNGLWDFKLQNLPRLKQHWYQSGVSVPQGQVIIASEVFKRAMETTRKLKLKLKLLLFLLSAHRVTKIQKCFRNEVPICSKLPTLFATVRLWPCPSNASSWNSHWSLTSAFLGGNTVSQGTQPLLLLVPACYTGTLWLLTKQHNAGTTCRSEQARSRTRV